MKTTNKILLTGGALTAGADALITNSALPIPDKYDLPVKLIIAIITLISFFLRKKKEEGESNG